VDFADVKMVMTNSDMALMGLGRAAGEGRVQKAAEQALSSPLLNNNDISGAKNILVNVSSCLKKPLKTYELRELMDYINTASGRGANFKRGVTKDESLDDESSDAEITVTIIATGFSMDNSFPDINDDIKQITGEDKKPDIIQIEGPNVIPLSDYDGDILIRGGATNVFDLTPKTSKPSKTSKTPKIETINTVNTVNETIDTASLNRLSQVNMSGGIINTWGSVKEEDIEMLEKIPAIDRMQAKIATNKTTGKEVSKHRLDELDGNHVLTENNSFLDRDVD
jgi:cell division protein FtsZ